jgi:hypothetical protein
MPDNQKTPEFDRHTLFLNEWDGKAEEVFNPTGQTLSSKSAETRPEKREETIHRLIDRIKAV